MQPMTREVLQLAQDMEMEQFRHPEDRDRINEIRALALEQVRSDEPDISAGRRSRAGTRPDGRGGDYLLHFAGAPEDSGEHLWRRWTPAQIALETGMAQFKARLSPRQRDVIALRYGGHHSLSQAAKVLNISKGAAQTHEQRALTTLKRDLTAAFLHDDDKELANA